MPKRKSKEDFRSSRRLLPDEVFLISGGPYAGPTDLVTQQVWNGIMHLPDDVAIRTSDHHGTQLAALYTLWGDWIEANGDDNDEPLFAAMLNATDSFQSSTFDALHGYYRSALSNLRSALDSSPSVRLETLHRPTTRIFVGRRMARCSHSRTADSDCDA
jgi:hypothetical protein